MAALLRAMVQGVPIFCSALGRTHVVETDPSTETVAALKHRIAERSGLPPCEQRLCHGVKRLRDDCTLEECGVGRDDTVRVLMRLLGGTAYMCGDCGAMNDIKARDPIRCRVCGYRIMYKVRQRGLAAPALRDASRRTGPSSSASRRHATGAHQESDPVRGALNDGSLAYGHGGEGGGDGGGEGGGGDGGGGDGGDGDCGGADSGGVMTVVERVAADMVTVAMMGCEGGDGVVALAMAELEQSGELILGPSHTHWSPFDHR